MASHYCNVPRLLHAIRHSLSLSQEAIALSKVGTEGIPGCNENVEKDRRCLSKENPRERDLKSYDSDSSYMINVRAEE